MWNRGVQKPQDVTDIPVPPPRPRMYRYAWFSYILMAIAISVFAHKVVEFFGPLFLPSFVALGVVVIIYAGISLRSLIIPFIVLLMSVGMLRFVWNFRAPMLPDFYLDRISLLWLLFILPILYIYTKKRLRGPFLLDSLLLVHSTYILTRIFMTSPEYFHTWSLSIFTPYAIYFFAKNIVFSLRQIRIILIFLLVLVFYYSVTSIAEKFQIGWLLFPRHMIEPHPILAGRSSGPFRSPAVFGNTMAMILPIFLYFIHTSRSVQIRVLLGVGFILASVGIFFTYTRGCILTAAIGLGVAAWLNRSAYLKYLLPLGAVIPIVAIALVGVQNDEFLEERLEATNPIEARIGAMVTGVRLWQDYPLWGCGPYQYKDYAPSYVAPVEFPLYGTVHVEFFRDSPAHDMYFSPTAEDGLVGQIILWVSYIIVLRVSWQKLKLRRQGDHFASYILPLFFAIYVIYLVAGFIISFRHFAILGALFWMAAGIAYGYDPADAEEKATDHINWVER